MSMYRSAKIIATIGPSSNDEDILEKMILSGMNVARLNFSHGNYDDHASRAKRLRKVAEKLHQPLAIMQDLQGPKIRVGILPLNLEIQVGEPVLLYAEGTSLRSHIKAIPVDFLQIFTAVKTGDTILVDDGRVKLRVEKRNSNTITAVVVNGGTISSHKGINLPGIQLRIPAVTEKDHEDLQFGLDLGVEAVALSFVQTAEDIKPVRNRLSEVAAKPLLIAKLERPQALENLDAILDLVDGVMVARGDLGVEMAPEKVPDAQKRIIRAANQRGKIVITATQMLETMIHSPLPTRAEASDIANAIYDGTDAVMLSAETAAGDYPVESVAMMDRIIRQAEVNYDEWGQSQPLGFDEHDDSVAVVHAARELAQDRDVEAIAIFTRTGRTAVMMSKSRPCVPILAFTPEEETYEKLAMVWGVKPQLVPMADTVEQMIAHVESAIHDTGIVHSGGQVVLVSGYPVSEIRLPNMALLHTIR